MIKANRKTLYCSKMIRGIQLDYFRVVCLVKDAEEVKAKYASMGYTVK